MNYELARRLHASGFPQEGAGTYYEQFDAEQRLVSTYMPTLDELIEATGSRYMFKQAACWTASFRNIRATGPTLDVALARLWLAVKPKRYAGHEAHQGKN